MCLTSNIIKPTYSRRGNTAWVKTRKVTDYGSYPTSADKTSTTRNSKTAPTQKLNTPADSNDTATQSKRTPDELIALKLEGLQHPSTEKEFQAETLLENYLRSEELTPFSKNRFTHSSKKLLFSHPRKRLSSRCRLRV